MTNQCETYTHFFIMSTVFLSGILRLGVPIFYLRHGPLQSGCRDSITKTSNIYKVVFPTWYPHFWDRILAVCLPRKSMTEECRFQLTV